MTRDLTCFILLPSFLELYKERSKSMEEKTEREDAALKTQISSDESEVLSLGCFSCGWRILMTFNDSLGQ